MTTFLRRARTITAGALIVAGAVVVADGLRFSDFDALTASAGPTANEAMPITFGNPDFRQESIAARQTQLLLSRPNSGSFDMIAVNETGPDKSRYLFTVFETGSSGVQRTDLETRDTETIWQTPAAGGAVSFDACYWTPWGTLITAEESWATAAAGSTSPYGRLFELRNPLTAPGIINPVTAFSNVDADFVHRRVIPRVSHEGIQFDQAGNMYFIDELDGGNLYKYTPKANWGQIMAGKAEYFDAGQTFVLRVGDGNTPNATGNYVMGSDHQRERRRPAGNNHDHRYERRLVGRRQEYDEPCRVQRHRLHAARGHADPVRRRQRVPLCHHDVHPSGLSS